ncbi:MAG TPA: lysyl oxidase family protein [Polyangiaceae bacterium]|nr:lysyl oxidase family protein [Polyangiaceae bacterium]
MTNTSISGSLASTRPRRTNGCSGVFGLSAVASIVVACGSNGDASTSALTGVADGSAGGEHPTAQPSGTDAGTSEDRGSLTQDATSPPLDAAAPDSAPDASVSADAASDLDGAGDDADAEMGPQVCGFTPCDAGEPCPDLVIDQDDLASSVIIEEQTFAATSCAIVDGCITQTGARRLLRFDTGIANVGTSALTIGNPADNACFVWSQCHEHYHFKGVAEYTLYEMDGTTVAAVGHKQGFCMEDVVPAPFDPGPTPAAPFNCTNQGLDIGWEDVYPNDLDCQWVDITGIPSGTYILSVHINAAHYLPESNYDNDIATVTVTVP